MANGNIPEIQLDLLELKQPIGRGGYGQVMKALYKGMPVAVKIPLDESAEGRRQLMNEMVELYSLRHDNVIKVIGMCTGKKLTFVMELMEDGSMEDLIHKHAHLVYKVDHVLSWAKQCADAMAFLHGHLLMHRDLKPANLLLKNDYHVLKVCDFGTARRLRTTSDVYSNNKGSPVWMPPEIFKGNRYNLKCDVYSFGITFWEMLVREWPFGTHLEPFPLLFRIVTQGLHPPRLDEQSCPPVIAQLITRCWDHNPKVRPSMNEVLEILTEFSRMYPNSSSPLETPGSAPARKIKKGCRPRESSSPEVFWEGVSEQPEDEDQVQQQTPVRKKPHRLPPRPEGLEFLDSLDPDLHPVTPQNFDRKTQKAFFEQLTACKDLSEIEGRLRDALKIKHSMVARLQNIETTAKLLEKRDDLKASLQEFSRRIASQKDIPPTHL